MISEPPGPVLYAAGGVQLADGVEAILFDAEVRRTYIEGAERRRLHWGGMTSAAEQHAKILDGTIQVPSS